MTDDAPTKVGSLDMDAETDRALLRRSFNDSRGNFRPRWGGIDDETKGQFVRSLKAALSMAIQRKDPRAINSCVKTLATLEGQNQSDEHMAIKHERLDAGQPTELVKVVKGDCWEQA
jgi:hypothetical protein